jgi:hypothetical protein
VRAGLSAEEHSAAIAGADDLPRLRLEQMLVDRRKLCAAQLTAFRRRAPSRKLPQKGWLRIALHPIFCAMFCTVLGIVLRPFGHSIPFASSALKRAANSACADR